MRKEALQRCLMNEKDRFCVFWRELAHRSFLIPLGCFESVGGWKELWDMLNDRWSSTGNHTRLKGSLENVSM